ncbi:hypothetical protein K474DRAFT_1657116 [Panus rudis PR-1116 ss-1]|nr:hypothetical protein K474DRAFT_1657116 [Panus rudis PR-1116 ss-1]
MPTDFCGHCRKPASKVCSACKEISYCSLACQKAAWKKHKGVCRVMQDMNIMMDAGKPKVPPPNPGRPGNRCTGCKRGFNEEYKCYRECPDCRYMACERCEVRELEGSCYCPNSNFGHSYCLMEPMTYNTAGPGGKIYSGDRHPKYAKEYREDMYEPEPRACNNCGMVTKILKKEFCKPKSNPLSASEVPWVDMALRFASALTRA